MKTLTEFAKGYFDLGWSLISIKHKEKLPEAGWKSFQTERAPLDKIEEWFGNGFERNVAVVCGCVSDNLCCLDDDGAKGEYFKGKVIPVTPTFKSARGSKYLFKYPVGVELPSKHFPHLKIDFICNGGYVLLPPSIHPSGTLYEWDSSPFDIPLAEIPEWLLKMVTGANREDNPDTRSTNLTIQAITDILKSFWQESQRDLLNFSLCGYLAKEGWPSSLAEELIKAIAAEDEEKKNRLDNLKRIYQRYRQGKDVKGYSGLKEILPAATLERLDELVKTAVIPFEMKEIDKIRQMDIRAYLRKRKIATFVCDSFREVGEYIRTQGGEYFYFDSKEKRLLPIEGIDLQSTLITKYGLNPMEEESRYTIKHLIGHIYSKGRVCEVYRMCYYDKINKILYVDLGGGQLAKLDGCSVNIVNNGTDGILFLEEVEPVKPIFNHELDLREILFNDVNFSSNILTRSHQIALGWNWFLSLFFYELLPTQPLLALIGPKGAGKTAFLKRIQILLYGWQRRHLDSVSTQDDFEVTVSSRYLVTFDNVDGEIKWLSDALAKIATGISYTRRKLYTTMETLRVVPRCFLALNSRTPEFRREDVADRLLLLHMNRILKGEFVLELKFIENVCGENRDRAWGSLLTELNGCVRYLKAEALSEKLEHRLADWSALALTFAKKDGNCKELVEALNLMEKERISFTLEDDPLIPFLEKLQDGKWRSAKEIWELLGGSKSDFKSAISVGKHLTNSRESFAQFCDFKDRSRKGAGKEYLFPRQESNASDRVPWDTGDKMTF